MANDTPAFIFADLGQGPVAVDLGSLLAAAGVTPDRLVQSGNPLGDALASKATKGANADITSLYGPNGAGIDLRAAATTLAAAATVDLGAATTLKVLISGTSTITSFGSVKHALRLVTIQAALTLTHNATSLILPGGANIAAAAGDTLLATSDASGNWTVRHYQRASGKPLAGPAAADISDASTSGRTVLTGTPAAGASALGLGTGNAPTWAGGTFTGEMKINGAAGTDRMITFQTAGKTAFGFGVGGANSDIFCNRHDIVDGSYLGTPINLNRSTGVISFNSGVAASGTLVIDQSRHIRFRIYTRSALPTPSSNNLGWAEVSNPESGKSPLVRNTGSSWLYQDGSAVTIA